MAQRSYTTIDDPRWNYRHIDQLNQLLAAFVEARRKKKAEQEGRAFETAQLAMGAIDKGADPNDPSIQAAFAAMPAAQGGVLRAMAKAAAGDIEGKKAATNAYNSLLKRAEEQRQAELLKALTAQQVPEMLSSDQNYAAAHAPQPSLPELLQQSMRGMPIDQQMAALPQMQKAGVDMQFQAPREFQLTDMPNDLATLALAGGWRPGQPLPPDVLRAGRFKTGLEQTPEQLANQRIAESNLGLREREVKLREEGGGVSPGEARAARAEARTIANEQRSLERQAKADERQRVSDQIGAIRTRALEIRQEHADAQIALPREEKTPPPTTEIAKLKAAREVAPQVSPRLGAALDQVGQARAALAAQVGPEKGTAAVPVVAALRKAEDDTLRGLVAGKDPELLAEALERFLAALGQR